MRIGRDVVHACYLQHGTGPTGPPLARGWADRAEIAGVCRDAAGGPDRAVVRQSMGRHADILIFSVDPATGRVRLDRSGESDAESAGQAMAQAARGGCVRPERR